MIRQATKSDLLDISNVFVSAFPDSIAHVLGEKPAIKGAQLVFRTLFKAESQAFFVAEKQQQIVGYIFTPTNINKLWLAALKEFLTFKWLFLILKGDLRISFKGLRILLSNKVSFISSAKEKFPIKARILSVAVLPDFQGHGIGRILVEKGLEYLNSMGVAAIRLEVRPDNIAAVDLYKACGFCVVGNTLDSQGQWLIMVRQ